MNADILEQIRELSQEYEYNWAKPIDVVGIPSVISQEELLIILRRIVNTGESILVGYDKIFLG